MKLLVWIGYLFMGVLCVILGNLFWNVISVKWAEKNGFKMPEWAKPKS